MSSRGLTVESPEITPSWYNLYRVLDFLCNSWIAAQISCTVADVSGSQLEGLHVLLAVSENQHAPAVLMLEKPEHYGDLLVACGRIHGLVYAVRYDMLRLDLYHRGRRPHPARLRFFAAFRAAGAAGPRRRRRAPVPR